MFSHGNASAGERAEAPKGHSLRALPKTLDQESLWRPHQHAINVLEEAC
jgi:hypothetical protein